MQIKLFHRSYRVNYYTKGFTSLFFCAVCLLCILVAPFFIALAMQNFWLKDNYFFHDPNVNFTGRCALRVGTILGKEFMWTCSENFNEAFLYGSSLGLVPYLSIYQDKRDSKGRVSDITFTLSISINDFSKIFDESNRDASVGKKDEKQVFDSISYVEFLPEFIYDIDHYLIRLKMTAAPLLRFSRKQPPLASTDPSKVYLNSGPLSALTVADLLFQSTSRLSRSLSRQYIQNYEASPFVEYAKDPSDLYNLAYFSQFYASRNQSVTARVITETSGGLSLLYNDKNTREVWGDTQLLNAFTWRINLRVQKAQLFYIPSFAESLKWAWVQYFVIAYITQWFFWWIRGFVTMSGIVDTQAVFTRKLC